MFRYLDISSLFLVVGGTLTAAVIQFSWASVQYAFQQLRLAISSPPSEPHVRLQYLLRLSHVTREQGMLPLDREASRADDPFLKLAFELAADGQSSENIRKILETEMATESERTSRAVQVFQTMGGYAPAMGLIGTLVGLIQMLNNLKDPTTVGPAMSLALIATLYGAISANLIFLPLAGKIRARQDDEALIKRLTIEGIESIVKVESTIVLQQKMQVLLPAEGMEQWP